MQIARGAVLGAPSPAQSENPNEARALIPHPQTSRSADGEITAATFDPQSPDRDAALGMELAQTIPSVSLPAETKSAPASEQGDSIQPELDGPNPIGETSREGNDSLANFGNSVRYAERAILQALLANPVPAPLSSEATESIDAALGGRANAHRDLLPSASPAAAAAAEGAKNNDLDEPGVSFMSSALAHSPAHEQQTMVSEPSQRDPSEHGNAIGRGHVSGSEKNLEHIIAAIARNHSDELTQGRNLASSRHSKREANGMKQGWRNRSKQCVITHS
jgi:hypothetical protein